LPECGKVKWFNENRGYGFIRREKGGNDIYVHYSHILGEGFRTLSEGELVEFDLLEGERGLEARNVSRVERKKGPCPDGPSDGDLENECGR
jgi:CspA family cold shock protein